MAKRYWARFYSPDGDPRPMKVPAPCQWWCSGTTGDERSVICAIVRAEDIDAAMGKLAEWWPGLVRDGEKEVAEDWVPGDRFPSKAPSDDSWREVVL